MPAGDYNNNSLSKLYWDTTEGFTKFSIMNNKVGYSGAETCNFKFFIDTYNRENLELTNWSTERLGELFLLFGNIKDYDCISLDNSKMALKYKNQSVVLEFKSYRHNINVMIVTANCSIDSMAFDYLNPTVFNKLLSFIDAKVMVRSTI